MQSLLQGHEGLLGLHAADAGAERFYGNLNEFCGGLLFRAGIKTGVAGPEPFPDRRAVTRPYYETTPSGAESLLTRYLRPKQ